MRASFVALEDIMKKIAVCICAALVVLTGCADNVKDLAPLPNPEPLRQVLKNGKPVDAEIRVFRANDQEGRLVSVPDFKFANKSLEFKFIESGNKITAYPNNPILYVNGREFARISLWGINKNGFGYPFKEIKGDPPTQEIDVAGKKYIYRRPYLDNNGKRAVAVMKVEQAGPSKLKVSWDSGSPIEGVSMWIVFDAIRDIPVFFGGKKWEYKQEAFLKKQKNFEYAENVTGDILISGGAPTSDIRIAFDGDAKGEVTDAFKPSQWGDHFGLIYRNRGMSNHKTYGTGSMTIDFGECYVDPRATPCVGELNFWELDATHVPLPATRNVMPNPGFEQGVRYWKEKTGASWDPAQPPAFEISNDAYEGSKALLVRRDLVVSFPMSLKKGKKYTLSFYAKSAGGQGACVSIKNAAKGGTIPGTYGVGGIGDYDSKDANFLITPEWKRYSRSFTADEFGLKVYLSGNGVLFDAIQLEEGSAPTDFVKPPLEGNLLTSAPMNDLSVGEPINGVFEVYGKPGTRGKVKLSVKNIYYENLYEKVFDVAVGKNSVARIPLDLDADKLGQGIFCVRADFAVEGLPVYTDYYRFNIMKKLSNTHATKNIFGTGLAFDNHPRADIMARKLMEWGFGSTNWYDPISTADYENFEKIKQPTTDLFKKYRITNTLFSSHIEATDRRGIVPELRKMKRSSEWREFPPELFKTIEEDMRIQLSRYPEDLVFCYAPSNEEENKISDIFDEYFEVQKFVRDLAKKLRPGIKVAPTHGTCQYNPGYSSGVKAINKYMELANKHGFKWDFITVHMYDSYDVDPENDVDCNISMLRSNMSRYGYGDETPIQISECGNICDVSIPIWQTRWYDHYNSGRLSYDFNNQEIYQACVLARLYLAALKYYPQMTAVNTWIYHPAFDLNFSPILLCKAVNTLGNLYSDVKFVSDVRPFRGMRAYVFKDNANRGAIAALWCSDLDVVRGKAPSPSILVKFSQPVKFYDINGNLRASPAPDEDGFVKIPVTFAPLSIVAADPVKLVEDLKLARLPQK